ncbi:MAG: uroporphyrinogen decarboxylase [Anaerolineae bacterium]|nr:uroporphyrinogen decarboxylase [Anaerolineae bacterium]
MTSIQLTHRQLIEKCLNNEVLPRTPVALWQHFPVDDQSADNLLAATVNFQQRFDFDLIKVSPSSSFCLKGWGSEDKWTGNPEGSREYVKFPIMNPEDWKKITPLSPKSGQMAGQLSVLDGLVKTFAKDTPIIQTIFSPLSQAKNLIGRDRLIAQLRLHPEAVHSALKVITQTTINFIEEAAKTGIDGIFYAIQQAQYGLLTEDEFKSFAMPYDLLVLETVQNLWFNMLHLHGDNVMFDIVSSYPVQVINWHDRQTQPSLAEAQKKYKGTVCGGLKQWETMAYGTSEDVKLEAADAIQSTSGRRFILGTGCVMPVIAPYGNIMAAINTARPTK